MLIGQADAQEQPCEGAAEDARENDYRGRYRIHIHDWGCAATTSQ
jgi:hypothetical protein